MVGGKCTCCSESLSPIVIINSLNSSRFINPSQSSSKHLKAFLINSSGSAASILEANMDRNLAKFTLPVTSLSISFTCLSVGFCPREIKIVSRSSLLITPSWSWSIKLNASFSCFSCSLLIFTAVGVLKPVLLDLRRGRILPPSLWNIFRLASNPLLSGDVLSNTCNEILKEPKVTQNVISNYLGTNHRDCHVVTQIAC